jgi:hypothetical protein
MRLNDPRTDNWAGRRDPGSDPNNFRFPRSAREAGFHYQAEQKEPNMMFYIVIMLIFVIGCVVWVG